MVTKRFKIWLAILIPQLRLTKSQVNIQHDAPGDDGHDVERQSERPISIPACADFYISYATAPGTFPCVVVEAVCFHQLSIWGVVSRWIKFFVVIHHLYSIS